MTMAPTRGAVRREDLQTAVQEAILRYDPLRTTTPHLSVDVRPGGVVEVSGPVRTETIREVVIQLVQRVPGVSQVIDGIVSDPSLEVAVSKALASNPKTAAIQPGTVIVRSHSGVITLLGRLSNESLREEVLRVAREVDGVRQVNDRLT